MRRASLAAILLTVQAACGGGTPRPAVPARIPVAAGRTAGEGTPWTTRKLTWGDYRAAAPLGAPEAAMSVVGLQWGFRCTGARFAFEVHAVFFPEKSWVKRAIILDQQHSRSTLRHEQTHFDISEVHARRMQRALQALTRPCARSVEALGEVGDGFLKGESDAQRRYDDETANGRDARAQARWDVDVETELKKK
jgi:hypothetical protein